MPMVVENIPRSTLRISLGDDRAEHSPTPLAPFPIVPRAHRVHKTFHARELGRSDKSLQTRIVKLCKCRLRSDACRAFGVCGEDIQLEFPDILPKKRTSDTCRISVCYCAKSVGCINLGGRVSCAIQCIEIRSTQGVWVTAKRGEREGHTSRMSLP